MTYLIYVALVALMAIRLAKKTDRKWLSFALIFWMGAQPVFNAQYTIVIPGLAFVLPLNRILLLAMLAYLLWSLGSSQAITKVRANTYKRPSFEKYLYVYLALIIIGVAINFAVIGPKQAIAVPLEVITFIVVYVATKRYMTERALNSILDAVIILGIVAAFIAIVQVAIEPMFMRTGEARGAFGDVFRASGMFQSEYDFGYFQNLAMMVMLVRYQGKSRLYVGVPLLILSVFLTFHRMNYIITFMCFASYLVFFRKGKKFNFPMLLLMILVPFVLVTTVEIYQSQGGHSRFLEDRMEAKTVAGRFNQYEIVWEAIKEHPLGLGNYENPIYYNLMNKYNMMQWIPDKYGVTHPEPLAVHNGYLDAGIRYGALGMLTFAALVISMLVYFMKRISPQFLYSVIPFYAVFIYVLANFSNGISTFYVHYVILLAMICGSFVARYRSEAGKKEQSPANSGASANLA